MTKAVWYVGGALVLLFVVVATYVGMALRVSSTSPCRVE
jgi:hypothetical protein